MAMSGGVDSSVSAALLLEEGYEVVGAFMKNWSDQPPGLIGENGAKSPTLAISVVPTPGVGTQECSWRTERRDAMRVAAKLGIELLTFDFEEQYREQVYEYMIREYRAGRTPNPDVLCNKYMKFGLLLDEAKKLGCEFVATGHYARTRRDDDGTAHLLAGVDENKDQSYFLCRLTQDQLKHVMFPIGDIEKSAVREKARELELSVADKKDSQGICFVGKVALADFLKDRIPAKPGKIITTTREEIGEHKGYAYYTIGQRTGLGVGGGEPWYVVDRRPETNELVVAHKEDKALLRSELIATEITETVPGIIEKYIGKPTKARIRYRQELQDCVVDESMNVTFDQPQWAVAPGQFIAFYAGDELIGSGIIE